MELNMRKLISFVSVLLACLIFSGSLLAEGSKGIALALKVKGTVKLKRDGKTDALKFGVALNDGDVVLTGKDGFVTLVFTDDKTLIKLTANTEVTIQGKRDGEGNIAKRISLEIGNLFAKTIQLKGTLEVATPTSVASVKGTEFWVVFDEAGNSYVITLDGWVELMSKIDGRIVEVRKSQRGEVDADGNIFVVDVPEGELPGDPDPDRDEGDVQLRTFEIDFIDEEGNIRTIRVEFLEHGQDGDDE